MNSPPAQPPSTSASHTSPTSSDAPSPDEHLSAPIGSENTCCAIRFATHPASTGIRSPKDIRPVYTAATEAAAKERFTEFTATWGVACPAITQLWENAWSEFVPFLDYDVEIRRIICSTNAVESLNARYRRAIRARGHFPTEQAAMKCLYLVTRSLDPTGRGKARWAMRWKPALNAFAITFNGRITPTGT